MVEWTKLAGYLLSPFTAAFGVWLVAGLLYACGRGRTAVVLAIFAVIGLWVASMPITDQVLTSALESRHPALTVEASPVADAVVVLGGAVGAPQPPRRPHLSLGPAAGRIWHAAALYRAGKAKWVVVAAGGRPQNANQQVEAEAIAEMLTALGVPRQAILLDRESTNTRENALNSRRIVESIGAKKVLLVTSAIHMERAERTFRRIWAGSALALTPAVTDVRIAEYKYSGEMWLPSLSSLENVTKAMKEYAGLAVLAII